MAWGILLEICFDKIPRQAWQYHHILDNREHSAGLSTVRAGFQMRKLSELRGMIFEFRYVGALGSTIEEMDRVSVILGSAPGLDNVSDLTVYKSFLFSAYLQTSC